MDAEVNSEMGYFGCKQRHRIFTVKALFKCTIIYYYYIHLIPNGGQQIIILFACLWALVA